MIHVYLRDGLTVYAFEDAGDLRKLMHERPGHKPTGGGVVEVKMLFRNRGENGEPKPELIEAGTQKLRYLARASVSQVVEA